MSPTITYMILAFMALYGLIILIEFIITRAVKRFFYQILPIVGFIVVLSITTDFPSASNRIAFGGGVSPTASIGIMFVGVILGMVASLFYGLRDKEKFSWKLLKPLFISPIVLLPLIGSVQGTSNLEPIQLISFGILAFQNGFFWKVVFERAKKAL
ncbi:MAG: hypothetical protein AAB116_08375 [Candidatus Poribacteria bacterium]